MNVREPPLPDSLGASGDFVYNHPSQGLLAGPGRGQA